MLNCKAILEESRIIVLIFIPLLDAGNDFEIFEAHSLPVPMQQLADGQVVVHNLLAEYELEAKAIAINKERSKYVLLQDDEVRQCIGSLASHCAMHKPSYPINLSKHCIVALFMRNKEKQQKNCETSVRTGAKLPIAEYLSSGVWIIATRKRLQFSIICQGESRPSEKLVEPPIGVINLPMSCTASNDYLSLPAYYQFDSVMKINDRFLSELQAYNFSALDIWSPLHTSLPTYNFSKIPPKLRAIKRMPIEPFIAELQGLGTIIDEFGLPSWAYILMACGSAILVSTIIVVCVYLKQKRKNNKPRERESDKGIRDDEERGASTHHMVAAATVTGTDQAGPPAGPSAPLLGGPPHMPQAAADPSTAVDTIIKRLYPSVAETAAHK